MNDAASLLNRENLPLELDSFGWVEDAETLLPGVFEAVLRPWNSEAPCRAYVVLRDAAAISGEAKRHGQTFPGYPDLLFYWVGGETNTHYIVLYEMYRYKILHEPSSTSAAGAGPARLMWEAAAYGAEFNPAYFGGYQAPFLTPWGLTLRNKVIANGIFWLETEQCRQGMAVALPLTDGLSDEAMSLACTIDGDGWHSPACFFFSKTDSCVALYELLPRFSKGSLRTLINRPALENAILEYHPKYAERFNKNRWRDAQDTTDYSVLSHGKHAAMRRFTEEKIRFSPDAGTDYLRF